MKGWVASRRGAVPPCVRQRTVEPRRSDDVERPGDAPGRAVMVGDSTVDVAAARAARIPVIVMSYGYTPVAPRELGADAVADDFSALPELISRLAVGG